MEIKKFKLFEGEEESESGGSLKSTNLGVNNFKIKEISKFDKHQIIFEGRNWEGLWSYLTIDFDKKTIDVDVEDEY